MAVTIFFELIQFKIIYVFIVRIFYKVIFLNFSYLRRLFYYRQMDFEFAFWQMAYLLSNPKVVYKNFTYRKKTKAQFARDDPAFLVLLAGWLVISS